MNRNKLAWVLVGILVVACLYLVTQVNTLNLKLQMMEEQMAKAVTITPANIKVDQVGGTEFNFSTVVASDGSVANTTTKELALNIINEDKNPAKIVVTLVNPKTGEIGLPKELRNSYVDVYFKVGSDTKYLYLDGKLTDGKVLTLDPASAVSASLGITLKQAPSGTFTDNQTYTITLYIVQPDAGNYVQSVTYTLKT